MHKIVNQYIHRAEGLVTQFFTLFHVQLKLIKLVSAIVPLGLINSLKADLSAARSVLLGFVCLLLFTFSREMFFMPTLQEWILKTKDPWRSNNVA